jgi:hypothetical protein
VDRLISQGGIKCTLNELKAIFRYPEIIYNRPSNLLFYPELLGYIPVRIKIRKIEQLKILIKVFLSKQTKQFLVLSHTVEHPSF